MGKITYMSRQIIRPKSVDVSPIALQHEYNMSSSGGSLAATTVSRQAGCTGGNDLRLTWRL